MFNINCFKFTNIVLVSTHYVEPNYSAALFKGNKLVRVNLKF